jgi:hypothetical protein
MLGPAISACLTIIVGVIVGLRMLRLATRTRKLPELLVGLASLFFVAAQAGNLAAAALDVSAGSAGGAFLVAIALGGYTGVQLAMGLSTIAIFGAQASRWALFAVLIVPGIVARIVAFQREATGTDPGPVLETVAIVSSALTFAWMGLEALLYLGRSRRAFEVGLVGPDVPNRFLIWGLGLTLSGLLTLAVAAGALHGWSSSVEGPRALLVTLNGLVHAVTWVLTLAPPEAYRRYVASRAPRAVAEHG